MPSSNSDESASSLPNEGDGSRQGSRLANTIFAIVVIAVSTAYLFAAYNLPHLDVEDPVGPRLFPMMVGILGVGAGLLLLVETKLAAGNPETAARAPNGGEHKILAVAGVLGWMAVFYLLLDWLGYIIASTIFLLGLTAFFNRGRWPMNIAVSVLFTVAIYATFTQFLGIQLPWGLLRF